MSHGRALQAARAFAEARQAPAGAAQDKLLALLHPEARYMALGREAVGAHAVATELQHGANGELARRLDWQAPEPAGAQVRLSGVRRAGTRDRNLVLVLGFEGDAIVLVQEQRMPAPPVQAQPVVLPPSLKRRIDHALEERHPILMAHTDAHGQPILSFRGSVQVFSDDQLALWIRNADGAFVQAIRHNPRVALMYRDEDAKATYQFQGRARVSERDEDREQVFARAPQVERAHDFARLGVAVIVDLDRVEGYAGLGPQGQVDGIRMLREAASP